MEKNPNKYSIESDDIVLVNPEKDGYTFSGWMGTVIDTQTTSVTISNGSTGDKEYVANYYANQDTKYTVIHKYRKLNSSEFVIEESEEYRITDTEVSVSGKHKDGFVDPTSKNIKIDGDGEASIEYEYEREEYSITFNIDGGSEVAEQTITYEDKATRPQLIPMKQGYDAYAFDAWYTDNTYKDEFDFDETEIEEDTVVYAKMDSCKGFGTDSWTKIKNNLAANPNYYPVGCQKTVRFKDNYVYTLRLVNTNTPEVCNTNGYSQTACGAVIEFVDVIDARQMNSSGSNAGGFKESPTASYLNSGLYNNLPGELKSVIRPTYPMVSGSGSGNDSQDITSDDTVNKIYYFSGREVGLDLENDNKNNPLTDTRTLDYYEKNNYDFTRKKYSRAGYESDWWLRTASSVSDSRYYHIGVDGSADTYNSSGISGNTPAFRIGEGSGLKVSFDTDGGTNVEEQLVSYNGYAIRPSNGGGWFICNKTIKESRIIL